MKPGEDRQKGEDPQAGEDRYEYAKGELTEESAGDDPLALFDRWLEEARNSGVTEPSGFCLATAAADGTPSARILLLRGFDERGFRFHSHRSGRKGRELAENPRAAMVFWWPTLERQIRIEGATEDLPEDESDAYWASRPNKSRAASSVSPQSRPIATREEVADAMQRALDAHPEGVPRPETWGGTIVRPERIEFWQGRRSRMHDRILFTRDGDAWTKSRLAP